MNYHNNAYVFYDDDGQIFSLLNRMYRESNAVDYGCMTVLLYDDILIIPASIIQIAHWKEFDFLLPNDTIEIVRFPVFCITEEDCLHSKANL